MTVYFICYVEQTDGIASENCSLQPYIP